MNIIEYKLRNGRTAQKIGLPIAFVFYIVVLYFIYYIAEHKLFGDIVASFWSLVGLVHFAITALTFYFLKKYMRLLTAFQVSKEQDNPDLEAHIVRTESYYYTSLKTTVILAIPYLVLLIASATTEDRWSFG